MVVAIVFRLLFALFVKQKRGVSNALKLIAIGTSTFGILLLLLDINTTLHSPQVQQIVAIKLMPLEQAKKGGFQMDTAREIDELTAIFLDCFYPVRQLSVRGAPALDPNGVEVNCNQQLTLWNFVTLA